MVKGGSTFSNLVTKNTGTPRTTTIRIKNAISMPGLAATAETSIAMPEVMKKIGMRNPKAIPSSLISRRSSPSGISRRRMKPAANAPRMTSSENTADSTPRLTNNRTVRRTVVCAVVSGPCPHQAMCPRAFVNQLAGQHRNDDSDQGEDGKNDQRQYGTTGTQQHRHRDDRPELADGPVVEDGLTQACVEEFVCP